MDYDLIGNGMDSLNEAIDLYKSGKKFNDESRFKYCILLLAHSTELILKQILFEEHEYLLYENIDEVKEDDPLTVGFKQALYRVKKICKIDFGSYENCLIDLVKIRNQIQHFRFKLTQEYCDKIIVQSFSAIEYIVIEVLNKTFNDFGDYISKDQIDYLHEDKDVYNKRKLDIAADIKKNQLKKYGIEYVKNKFIYIPCPICSELTLIESEANISCKFCGSKYNSYQELYDDDWNGIINEHIMREIGRKKHLFKSDVFECKKCNEESIILIDDRWKCLICGYEISDSISCDECGKDIPYSKYNYVFAQSYYDTDDYLYLCKDCGSKLREKEWGVEYEID